MHKRKANCQSVHQNPNDLKNFSHETIDLGFTALLKLEINHPTNYSVGALFPPLE